MTVRGKDEGAVLLTTLLVMSVMAALAVAIMDDIRFSVKRAANIQAYAQADWYRLAAEDFAETYLEQIQELEGRALQSALANPEPILFPIEGGALAFDVRDGGTCISVSALGKPQKSKEPAADAKHFRRLLTHLGWSELEAAALTTAIQDWQDNDSQISPGGAEDYTYLAFDPAYRTSNSPISSVAELRAIQGMTEERFQLLRPFLCAGANRATKININALRPEHAPVLAAVLGDIDLGIATQIIIDRPSGGYTEIDQVDAHSALEDQPKDKFEQYIEFEPKRVWIEADIQYLQARRTSVFEFRIDRGRAVRTYRRHSAEARRPRLVKPEDEAQTR